MDVSLSPSRPPLLGHNSWPDFSPPLPGLSLMTIHRKGSQLVKIKIRPEAVVNRAPTRPRRLTRPREKTGYYRRLVSRRANVSLSGRQSFFTPRRFERIVIDLSRNSLPFLFFTMTRIYRYFENSYTWMQLVYVVARREKVGGEGVVKQFAVRPAFFLKPRL